MFCSCYSELCALNKPAGRGLTPNVVVQAAKLASARASMLHEKLSAALSELEEAVKVLRAQQLDTMQRLAQLQTQRISAVVGARAGTRAGTAGGEVGEAQQRSGKEENSSKNRNSISSKDKQQAVGIDRNDPILQWSSLHQAAGLWE